MGKKPLSKRFCPPKRRNSRNAYQGKENLTSQVKLHDSEPLVVEGDSVDCSPSKFKSKVASTCNGSQETQPTPLSSRQVLTPTVTECNAGPGNPNNLRRLIPVPNPFICTPTSSRQILTPTVTECNAGPGNPNNLRRLIAVPNPFICTPTIPTENSGSLTDKDSLQSEDSLVCNSTVIKLNGTQTGYLRIIPETTRVETCGIVVSKGNQDPPPLHIDADNDILISTPPKLHVASTTEKVLNVGKVLENVEPFPVSCMMTTSPTNVNVHLLWQQVQHEIQSSQLIKSHWVTRVEGNCFKMLMLSKGDVNVVQRSIVCKSNGKVSVTVHGKSVPADHIFWERPLARVLPPLGSFSPKEMSHLIMSIFNALRDWVTCKGISDESLWIYHSDKTYMEEGFENFRYKEKTMKSTSCRLLVKPNVKRCVECGCLSRVLTKRKMRKDNHRKGTPNKYTPDSVLPAPQRKARAVRNRKNMSNLKKRMKRIEFKALLAVDKDGVDVESELDKSLDEALKTEKLTEFQKILIESQRKCVSAKKKCGMKWHPAMLRFALNIMLTSKKAYNVLQRYMDLPNRRTLFDYSHAYKSEEGIVRHFVENVVKKVALSKHPCSKHFMLSFDEMYISQNLVYRKETGAMVGYCHLNAAEKEIREMELALLDPAQPIDTTPLMAKTILTFMVRGVFTRITEVVAQFSVHVLSKEFLHQRHWDVVGYLEVSGLEICGCVCDGAPTNRVFFSMHKPVTKVASGVVFDTLNIHSWPRRSYYFFSDVPHLLKTIRNCLESPTRKLTKNNMILSWRTIQNVYEANKDLTLRKSWKLNAQCVYLNPYSRMKVSYAARVLSKAVANELKTRDYTDTSELVTGISKEVTKKLAKSELVTDTTELVTFIEKVNDFFDMLNGCSYYGYLENLNDNLKPYTSASDKRLGLLDDFLEYLFTWQREVASLKGPKSKKEFLFISEPTLVGIEMTVRSFTSVIKRLLPATDEPLEEGQKPSRYIMARVFNQDYLEKYFGKQRARNGGSTNPNLNQCLLNANAMFMVGQVNGKIRNGNTETEAADLEAVPCDSTPLLKRIKLVKKSCSKELFK